jgi:2-polyprenyl-3-methyl-5-hydroxy-6-metoxy-1,4-benzoquinol methylase
MTNDEKLRRSWTSNAEAWTEAVRGRKIESRRLATDDAIVSAILDLQPKTVLDLGCGEGWLTRALTAPGILATGVDASPELIRAAQELGGGTFVAMSYGNYVQEPFSPPQRGEGARSADEGSPSCSVSPVRPSPGLRPPSPLARGEGLSTPVPPSSDSYDVIAANFSLLEEDLTAILSALRARLTPGGALVVQTVHPAFAGGEYVDGWRVETFAAMEGEWREPMPWYFRTLASWMRAFVDAGYVITDVREPLHPEKMTPLSVVFIAR